ncbi:hypothetical protein AGMMS4952_27880 [Spirochaetia bacterium]|nr:hypothetical protein AGMMS4952_27880 [Spirochaetia bacterium]
MPTTRDEAMTFEKVWAMFQDIGRKQEETYRQMKETDRQMKETERILKESGKETDRILQKLGKETDRLIEENWQLIGGMANSDGDAAEEHFASSLESKMMFAGQHYDAIIRNLNKKTGNLRDEFDIVLYNCTSVAIVEIKNKANQEDVTKLVTQKLPNFRTFFPEYKDHAIYLGIGSMSFDSRVVTTAQELGIGILRQKGDTIEADTGFVRAY